jgi:glucosylglycerol 3-phosphatase
MAEPSQQHPQHPFAIPKTSPLHSTDDLLEDLAGSGELLIVQDLDGVCMPLVRDPRRRQLDPGYLHAARRMEGRFAVLTNGEHGGSRGVNRLVEQALDRQVDPAREGFYLPGLGAGGVELQNRFGQASHPGVQPSELRFLAAVPKRLAQALRERLPALLPELRTERLEVLLDAVVLDNTLSPSLNLNALFAAMPGDAARQQDLQSLARELMEEVMEEAASELTASFFLHLAPNLGQREGREQLKPAGPGGTGTTDLQLMLRGALKEVGLLVLINQTIAQRTGQAPLGDDFNVRTAPHDHPSLLALARSAIDPAQMPRLVGVGDTITSETAADGRSWLRGGSDRGFLTLLQELGKVFGTANRVVLVDSSGGEVDRPSLADGRLSGISDPKDPLKIDLMIPGGPADYVRFFKALAARQARG